MREGRNLSPCLHSAGPSLHLHNGEHKWKLHLDAFWEWLCYIASESQETIQYCLFYSHIWLRCMCWSMASKPAEIRNMWMWFALTLVCEGITKHVFSLDLLLSIGAEWTCLRTCFLCICNRERGPVLGMRSLMRLISSVMKSGGKQKSWEGQIMTI